LMEIDPDLLVTEPDLSIADGALPVFRQVESGWTGSILRSLAKQYGFSLDTPWKKLTKRARGFVLHGTGKDEVQVAHKTEKGEYRWRSSFEGVIGNLSRRYRETQSQEIREWIEGYMSPRPCQICGGARLRPETLAVRIGKKNIADITRLSVRSALETIEGLMPGERERKIAAGVIKEIRERLRFLDDVGLTYLTLDRASSTLSGGEAQRIRLATQIGSHLVGVLYILDEPSIGLHHRDNNRLLATLKRLRDLGNTVVVVEHDRDTMLAADCLIDLGPGAGRHGGELVALGAPEEVKRHPTSLTGLYLSGKRRIPVPAKRRVSTGRAIEIVGARHNNLKDVTVRFPLGQFICVTGVSGSGKSSLVNETLHRCLARSLTHSGPTPGLHREIRGLEHIDKVISIDQSPIGRTPRSNAATYTAAFTEIRDLFARLPESKVRGYKPGRFSFNVKGGRCESCGGDGVVKIEMHFLPDVYVRCDVCGGKRYNRETLEVAYKGRSIAEVLDLTVEEAVTMFENIPVLRRRLGALRDVGLGYLHLGQAATTLSGGEAQRVKLATELSKVSTGRTVYILDEPTTGLHFEDIRILLEVLGKLVDAGNTVIVIEHQLDVVRTADHIIDLGPEGGDEGGYLIAEGTPEQVARVKVSHTGQALAEAQSG
jgi:excinuclease ABC subunit A